MSPVPPRNVRLRIDGVIVPVELRYDGFRHDPQAGKALHVWIAVTDYPAPIEGTPLELLADELPGLTSIYLQFID